MRFLLDSCISELAFNQLWSRSLDVVWMGHRLPDPGDAAILQMAIIENRVLVTGDKDFGELIVMRRIRQIGLIDW